MTPPELLLLKTFGGDWKKYENELYKIFKTEIARSGLRFRGLQVKCRRRPETNRRWSAFWHLIQEGPTEEERTPALRRCERIRWIRWIIENATTHPNIDEWKNKRHGKINTLLWYREEYLIVLEQRVLEQRENYWLLKTAYCTDKTFRLKQLRRERDSFKPKGV